MNSNSEKASSLLNSAKPPSGKDVKTPKSRRKKSSIKMNARKTTIQVNSDPVSCSKVKDEPMDVSNEPIEIILDKSSSKGTVHICKLCLKPFSKGTNLMRHCRNAHTDVRHECSTCHAKFPRKDSLARHISRKHDPEFDDEGPLECGHCCKRYKGKDALKRHISLTHLNDVELANKIEMKKNPTVCDKCGKIFATNYSLNRHRRNIHTKTNSFTCDLCAQTFYRKDALVRHIRLIHTRTPAEGYTFECHHCPKLFKEKDSVARHIRMSHPPGMNMPSEALANNEGRLECLICRASFSKESNLRRHCLNFHMKCDLFKCSSCSKEFTRKDTLTRHINRKHVFRDYEGYSYECHHCSKKFREKNSVAQHIRTAHMNSQAKEKATAKTTEFRCLICQEVFSARYLIKKHYFDEHNIPMVYDELKFDSVDEFKSWKRKMQSQTVTQYTSRSFWNAISHAGYRYCCHRSGMYDNSCRGRTRLRRMKRFGTKKLQGYCPAEILVRMRNDACLVTYQKTHVGHEIFDRTELRYINIDKDEKVDIAIKLQDGVPLKEIIKEKTVDDGTDRGNRLSVLNYNDGYNIARRFGVDLQLLTGVDSKNKIDVDSFIEQNEDAILFYKEPMVEDSSYETLKDEDFVVVIMEKVQENSLLRYGRTLVALDCTTGTYPCYFLLHTLLVVDIDFEGIPVAFLISNRGDADVIDIFFDCIRKRVGVVKTKTLMTDLDGKYLRCWVECMAAPEFHVYCSWHVRDEWHKMSTKIADRKKRLETYRTLLAIANELDPSVFEAKMNVFLGTEDEDLRDFVEYFQRTQINTTQCWANCYRKLAGVHANIHVNVFRRVLKMKKATSLFDCLQCIQDYLEAKDADVRVKCVRGKRLSKREYLRKRHNDAAKHSEGPGFLIEICELSTWRVGFFEEFNEDVEMYTVEKQEDKECAAYTDVTCQLMCDECGICFHEYRCSCADSCVRSNMCKHIHAIGITMQNDQMPEPILVDENGFVVGENVIANDELVLETITLDDNGMIFVANETQTGIKTDDKDGDEN